MWRDMLKEVGGTVLLLFVGMVFFTGVLIFVEFRFQSDGQVFQTVASLLAGFSGAFFGLMKAKEKPSTPTPPPSPPQPPVNP